MSQNANFLKNLLEYELRSSERYRRFLSVIKVRTKNQGVHLAEFLRETIRESDEMALDEGEATILMGDTDAEGAIAAVDRVKAKCGGDPCKGPCETTAVNDNGTVRHKKGAVVDTINVRQVKPHFN